MNTYHSFAVSLLLVGTASAQQRFAFEKPVRLKADGELIDTGADIGYAGPLVRDHDGDGKPDLLVSAFRGNIRFFKNVGAELDIDMPRRRRYGIGMVFLPADPAARRRCEALVSEAIEAEGQKVLGWRDVPTRPEVVGRVAAAVMTRIGRKEPGDDLLPVADEHGHRPLAHVLERGRPAEGARGRVDPGVTKGIYRHSGRTVTNGRQG